jgi:hypothetical protein
LRIVFFNSNLCQIILKITQDPDPGLDPKLSEKSDPDPDTDPKKIIPDPQQYQKDSGSRIRIKEFKCFNPKKLFLSSPSQIPHPHPQHWLAVDFFLLSRIRILIFTPPGSRGQKCTGSRIRIRNTGWRLVFATVACCA